MLNKRGKNEIQISRQIRVQVSSLSFGTMTFGGEADERESAEMYKKCREIGINLFDCANFYNDGRAEEILGRLIKHERKDVIVTSKACLPIGKDINAQGLSRRHIMHAVDDSLKRLQTDYIDIYFMHKFDEHTPIEESLCAVNDLVRLGKVLYLGVSNFAAWQIMKALGISQMKNLTSFSVIQPMYNLVKRQAEVEIFPLWQSENIGVISYNLLAGGLLTGKYKNYTFQEGTRFSERELYRLRYQDKAIQDVTNQFLDVCKQKGYSPVSLAIAWVMHHPQVTSPILGARNLHQLSECLKALEIDMTKELYSEITALSITPPVATDRSEELISNDPSLLYVKK